MCDGMCGDYRRVPYTDPYLFETARRLIKCSCDETNQPPLTVEDAASG